MPKLRVLAGFAAGVMLLTSAIAHSVLGWKGLSAELAKTNVPADLSSALAAGWIFGGVAMAAFGVLVLADFVLLARGAVAFPRASFVIGLTYALFGTVTIAMSRNPFFVVFVVPGLLLVAAAWPRRREG